MSSLLSIKELQISFPSRQGSLDAVRGVSLTLEKGSVLALVGESGSGKSMTALAIMGLLPPPGAITGGRIFFDGQELTSLSEERMRGIRGRSLAMVFQEPMTSLNPVLRIGDQVTEPLLLHSKMTRQAAFDRAAELLSSVGIPSAADRLRDYPHQLSGGMRQRVMIAMALACHPLLLIADEPTTALDVTIQAQILELLDQQRKSSGLALLLITHDLGIVAERSNHTAVMYAGQIVESAPTDLLLSNPRHPYTRALLASLPQYAEPGKPLPTVSNSLNQKSNTPYGCSFADRCPLAVTECRSTATAMCEVAPSHYVCCRKAL